MLEDSVSAVENSPTPPSAWNAKNIIGEAVTVSSIVPSGLFAALLMDLLLEKSPAPIYVRLIIDVILFAVTVEPKRRLMRAYNTGTFNDLLTLKKCQDVLPTESISAAKIINQVSSLLGGVTFGGIAYLSLRQLAELTRSYDTPIGNGLAVAVEYPVTLAYLMSTSFIANYLSFPSMQSASIGLLQNALSELLLTTEEQQTLFAHQAQLVHASKDLMTNFNVLSAALYLPIDQRDQAKTAAAYAAIKNSLVAIYPNLLLEANSPNTAIVKLLQHMQSRNDAELLSDVLLVDQTNSLALQHPRKISAAAQLISFGLTAMCIAGLSNFYSIALGLFSMVEPVVVAPLLATMVMLSMSLLAFISVYAYGPLVANKWEQAFNKVYPEVLTPSEQRLLLAGNSVMCAAGSLPNTYQALVLTKQSPPLVACAFLASFSLEVKASYDVTRVKKEYAAINALKVETPVIEPLFAQLKRIDALSIQRPMKTLTDFYSAIGLATPESSFSEPLLQDENKPVIEV